MITQIKTALLGEEHGQESQYHANEVDPFRPSADLADGANENHVDMDDVFGILENQRRRYVLKYLSMTEGTTTISDLAEQIAAWECNKEVPRIDSEERKRVYVALYQCHLPKMADVSAISYDRPRGKIESGEQFESFSYYLRYDGKSGSDRPV